MSDVFQQRDLLLTEITNLRSKAGHAHKLTCLAVRLARRNLGLARRNLGLAQVTLNTAEDAMRATAEVADADLI